MRFSVLAWAATKSLRSHRLGSLLVLLVIAVTTGLTFAMASLGFGWQDKLLREIAQEGNNCVGFWAGPPPAGQRVARGLRLSDLDYVRQSCPLLTAVCAHDFLPEATIQYQNRTRFCEVHAFSAGFPPVRNLQLIAGRSWTEAEDRQRAPLIVLGSGSAEVLFPSGDALGKQVRLSVRWERGSGVDRQATLTVIGVSKPTELERLNSQVFIPLSLSQHGLGYYNQGHEEIGEIIGSVPRLQDCPAGQEQMAAAMRRRNVYMDERSRNWLAFTLDYQAYVNRIFVVLFSLCLAAIFLSGLGFIKIMLLSVASRVPEIGLRKALGASPRQIQRQFLVEAVVTGTAGALLGLALGCVGIYLIGHTNLVASLAGAKYHTPPAMRAWLPIGLFLYVVGLAALGGVLPARRAARLDPVTAIRGQ